MKTDISSMKPECIVCGKEINRVIEDCQLANITDHTFKHLYTVDKNNIHIAKGKVALIDCTDKIVAVADSDSEYPSIWINSFSKR